MTTAAFRIFAVLVSSVPFWLFIGLGYAKGGRARRSWIRFAVLMGVLIFGSWIFYAGASGDLSRPTVNTFQD